MKLQSLLVSAAVLTSLTENVNAWSPNNSYVPANVTCDDDINLVREASGLSDNETEWLKKRDAYTKEALHSFLNRATSNFSDTSLLSTLFSSNSSNVPKIGIACSGGGYRAMLSGAGMLAAMDNRTDGANEHGLGGLLQGATYLAGLSGGNWLTSTLAWNNWTSVQAIVDNTTESNSIWDISHSILTPGGINIFKTGSRWDDISDDVQDKKDAGFNISLADVWGRALAYNFWPSLHRGGVGYTWSTLREADVFKNGEMPFPITVADGRYPGTTVINLNATLFEFNPFEMGSWDPTLNAFTDVKYLGTNVTNGKPVNKGQCIAGFDNTGFITATSSTLFNQFLLRLNSTDLPSFIANLATDCLEDLSDNSDDIAIYAPNPFKEANFLQKNATSSIIESEYLFLVDGGEDNQNIPLVPLLQKERELDVIFALDNSADTDDYWPDGASLVNTYQRQFGSQGLNLSFPYVPDVNTFVNLGLNKKPTFFGCDARNLTDLEYIPPLIVYIPNSRHSFNGNQSTFKMSYSDSERLGMIKNGFEAATMGNFTDDSDFLGCVGCAIIRRKQQNLNATLPSECSQCFTNYCWNGTIDSRSVSGVGNDDYSSSASLSASAAAASASAYASASASASGSSTHKKNAGNALVNYSNLNTNTFIGVLSVISAVFVCLQILSRVRSELKFTRAGKVTLLTQMQLRNILQASSLISGLSLAADSSSTTGDGYAPSIIPCPSDDTSLVRNASGLSTAETDWLKKRDAYTKEALHSFLSRATSNFSDTSLLSTLFSSNSSNVPKIGIACSGGGYRAMLGGAGMIAAMDNRTDGANEHGLGGLLQSSTYLSGLSGGNWLTGTLAWNNWTSVQEIVDHMSESDSIWNITKSIVNPGGSNLTYTIERWESIVQEVQAKSDAGFNISLSDLWARALSYNFFPSLPDAGSALTWSSLRDVDVFKNGEMPLPITVADGRYPGTTVINLNATLFEFTPFEMGSWDPSLNAFTDVKYLGTNVTNGKPVNKDQCVSGYDNAGFVIATSASLFNEFSLEASTSTYYKMINSFANKYVNNLSQDDDDIAIYAPNPFKDTEFVDRNYTSSIVDADDLFLVDGGEDGQNLPLVPLIKKERDLDVVFALDISDNTDESWPSGVCMTNTYERQYSKQGKGMAFPYVPDVNTFLNLGLTNKPTFFGCDAKNLTDLEYIPPLVVYIPNTKHSFNGNQSTLKMNYNVTERLGMIRNGFEAATMGNFTDDSNFLGCIGCAIIRRKQESLNATLPPECTKCFADYCWNGTLSTSANPELSGNSTYQSGAIASAISEATDGIPITALLGSSTSGNTTSNSTTSTSSNVTSNSNSSSNTTLNSNSSSSSISSSTARSSSSTANKANAAAISYANTNTLMSLLGAITALFGLI
ncbi:ANL_HP_G0009320.mRNA.1.CDS.1 [Saccharomyces cerevisiae]|nr:ANL_HP_G0009320.mRNA.1.CDS.1 [Saccharomyces cerevisiae]CAI7022830.1 ANL_HP_G0009320.mRNA.1.CDS.1 [Saccharomyces cerevisiae]